MLVRGDTRAQITRQMKERYGDLFLRVDYISHEDAEAQFGHFDLFKEGINIKKADMGDVVDDFYKSDAPQFKGRSKAKRRQMAIAAKLNTENNKYSDNYEDKNMSNVNEISRDMKNRYIKKASTDLYYKGIDQGISANDPNRFNPEKNPKLNDRMDKNRTKSIKRMSGIAKATEEFADFVTPESELTEEVYFKVQVNGLPDMYMTASSAGMIKAKLRKMLKNMDMIKDIVKTTKPEVRKAFRMKAMEGEDSQDESTIIEVKDGPKDTKLSPNTRALAKASDNRSRSTVIKAMNVNAPKDKAIVGRSYQEDVIDEISKKTMGSYVKKAVKNIDDRSFAAGLKVYSRNMSDKADAKNLKKIDNRTKGIERAVDKMSEDIVDNKIRFGKPSEEVFEKQTDDDFKLVNFTSILTGDNPFYRPIQEKIKVKEGHDEIQDKNVDGLDDNQKPEGNKTAKQFPAPKDVKKKTKRT